MTPMSKIAIVQFKASTDKTKNLIVLSLHMERAMVTEKTIDNNY